MQNLTAKTLGLIMAAFIGIGSLVIGFLPFTIAALIVKAIFF